MAEYQSLYRKHRPQTFGELVGQEHVTAALRNAVKDGRVGHAYLFSGPRGTGKTTTARILAKGLNCLALGADGEPCGTCENCVGVAAGRFLDLFELDAASNNSVDNIRDLTDSVHLGVGPTTTKKVYLIDEVHMLSAAASNALLKTLEEPPGHVVFVLATTNPEKVLPTIRSRTQHLEFTLLTPLQLTGHLADVLAREGVEADPEALPLIARAAAGSARDALSLLDQVLAHGADRIDTATVAGLFGRTPFGLRAAVLEAIAAEDPAGALAGVSVLFDAGHDARRVAEDLLRATRDAFLVTAGAGRVRIDAPDDELARLDELGRALGNPLLVRAIETLGQAVVDMRGTDAADPQLVLEVALVRLARRDAGPPLQALADRVERLERTGGVRARTTPAEARAVPERDDEPDEAVGLPPTGPATALGALRKAKPAGRTKASAGPQPEP
ncbi:MAG TPA: DNA polymerase III subunit gamma/tau, partial [Acidimicrobiia bacterium]|nr:DNA polymerase III subunit gamma/tau [Acidimicrobiia bacterium]